MNTIPTQCNSRTQGNAGTRKRRAKEENIQDDDEVVGCMQGGGPIVEFSKGGRVRSESGEMDERRWGRGERVRCCEEIESRICTSKGAQHKSYSRSSRIPEALESFKFCRYATTCSIFKEGRYPMSQPSSRILITLGGPTRSDLSNGGVIPNFLKAFIIDFRIFKNSLTFPSESKSDDIFHVEVIRFSRPERVLLGQSTIEHINPHDSRSNF
eukprot:Gb_40716 [translate_table: standard]